MTNNRTIISMRRHEKKDGDKLTQEGKERAILIGKSLDEEIIRIYHSPKNRAKETGEGILLGRYGTVDYAKLVEASLLLEINPTEATKEDIERYGGREGFLNYWMREHYNPNTRTGRMYDAGINGVTHLMQLIGTQQTGVVESITHTPNIETTLITLVDPRMNMTDIGGSFKEGENFTITVERTNNIINHININYRGQEKRVSTSRLYDLVQKM